MRFTDDESDLEQEMLNKLSSGCNYNPPLIHLRSEVPQKLQNRQAIFKDDQSTLCFSSHPCKYWTSALNLYRQSMQLLVADSILMGQGNLGLSGIAL